MILYKPTFRQALPTSDCIRLPVGDLSALPATKSAGHGKRGWGPQQHRSSVRILGGWAGLQDVYSRRAFKERLAAKVSLAILQGRAI